MKKQDTNQVLELIERKRKGSEIIPPMNKPILYKGMPGILLNDYGSGVVYFKLKGDDTISCDKKETIQMI